MNKTLQLIAAEDHVDDGNPKVLQLANDADPLAIAVCLQDIERIDLHFPKFTDGRAYSQAFLLRRRMGFQGEIRATGDVLIDQIPLMLRCGIDSFAVKNATALKRLEEGRLPGIAVHYQPTARDAEKSGGYSWRRRTAIA